MEWWVIYFDPLGEIGHSWEVVTQAYSRNFACARKW
jgi:hypothetical protein